MRVVRQTPELYVMARSRLTYIDSLLPSSRVQMTRELDRDIAFATVELLNCWARFSRSLYLSVCRGVRDAAGNAVSTSRHLPTYDDAVLFAASQFTRRPLVRGKVTHRDEPDWLAPVTLSKLLSAVGASNQPDVDAALSVPTRVFQDLPSVRNFYGHRGQDTARKATNVARNYGRAANLHPTQLCLEFAPGRPQSILRDWTYDLRVVMKLAVA